MLIDSEKLKQSILSIMPERSEVLLIVDNQPEGIVRCKDCKWHEMRGEMLLCKAQDKPHTYDWFCADGVAKDINVPNKEGR